MIRCRCGTWTNYGMTCSRCAPEAWHKSDTEPEEVVEIEEETEEEDDDDDELF